MARTNMTQNEYNIRYAYEKGYRIIRNRLVSPDGRCRSMSVRRKEDEFGYYYFSLKVDGHQKSIFAHRLAAYQKYRDRIFDPGIVVRHLDGDSLNNLPDNLSIGSQSDNIMDMPAHVRRHNSIHAAKKLRRFSDEEVGLIRQDREAGMTYKELMNKWDIPAKSSVNNILNRKYKTKV